MLVPYLRSNLSSNEFFAIQFFPFLYQTCIYTCSKSSKSDVTVWSLRSCKHWKNETMDLFPVASCIEMVKAQIFFKKKHTTTNTSTNNADFSLKFTLVILFRILFIIKFNKLHNQIALSFLSGRKKNGVKHLNSNGTMQSGKKWTQWNETFKAMLTSAKKNIYVILNSHIMFGQLESNDLRLHHSYFICSERNV